MRSTRSCRPWSPPWPACPSFRVRLCSLGQSRVRGCHEVGSDPPSVRGLCWLPLGWPGVWNDVAVPRARRTHVRSLVLGALMVMNPVGSRPSWGGRRRSGSEVRLSGIADRREQKVVTWLILPVVICLSQRLSHACLSISNCTAKLRMAH